ncbi:hypothetical protein [Rhodopila sp.]|uniref:hypothetical protein n=1 Tax=Rhodopila sp. TaxID=2480087 RepID=UPI003D0FFFD4
MTTIDTLPARTRSELWKLALTAIESQKAEIAYLKAEIERLKPKRRKDGRFQ